MARKKGRKGKEGKAQKVTQALHFTYLWGSPLQTDFHQILHIMRYAKPNHLCKFWCEKIKGFGIYRGSNFGVSHWNGWSPLQQCCTTAQPVIIYIFLVASLFMLIFVLSTGTVVWKDLCLKWCQAGCWTLVTHLKNMIHYIALPCLGVFHNYVHRSSWMKMHWHLVSMLLCRLLLHGAQLIAIHKGRYYRQQDGLSLGPGILSTLHLSHVMIEIKWLLIYKRCQING